MTANEALEITLADGRYKTALDMGIIAARESRPRCLSNGGIYEDPDNARIAELAGKEWPIKVALGNAWFEGHDSVTGGGGNNGAEQSKS